MGAKIFFSRNLGGKGAQLQRLTDENSFGEPDAKSAIDYPSAMHTPYIDLGLYPPVLSNGGGMLWDDRYITKRGHMYSNKGNYGWNANSSGSISLTLPSGNKSGYMSDMFCDSKSASYSESDCADISNSHKFITLAFLVTGIPGATEGNFYDPSATIQTCTLEAPKKNDTLPQCMNIRPCFASNNQPSQRWMYDTMANYFWSETNSLDNWIGSIRGHDISSDIILSYGGYNGRMSANVLWDIISCKNKQECTALKSHPFSEGQFISDIANDASLADISWAISTAGINALKNWGIFDVSSCHKSDNNYTWRCGTKLPIDYYYNNLYAAYYLPMKYYRVRWLDFDIEAAQVTPSKWPSQVLRILALRKLMMENKYVNVRFTFPTFPTGLSQGYLILYLTMYTFYKCVPQVRKRLYINLMTMDYGDDMQGTQGFPDAPGVGNSDISGIMGIGSVFAVCNVVQQMKAISKKLYKDNEFGWLDSSGEGQKNGKIPTLQKSGIHLWQD